MPPVQPTGMGGQYGVPTGAPMSGAPGMGGGPQGRTPSGGPGGRTPSGGRPMVQQVQLAPAKKSNVAVIVLSVLVGLLVIVAAVMTGMYFWRDDEAKQSQATIDSQIATAVATAVDEQRTQDEKDYREWEKNPYQTFMGPADYGGLTFQYPKTWSVYVEKDATDGGDFAAYFNPVQVNTVADETINALRFLISTNSYEKVVADYQKETTRKDAKLAMESCNVGNAEAGTQVVASCFSGTIPGTDLVGRIIVFKLRDKAVILQTDSSDVFGGDFDTLLGTITFNA